MILQSVSRPAREWLQFLLLLLVPLVCTLLLPRDPEDGSAVGGVAFEQEKYDDAAEKRPDVVFLGNSMLNTRADRKLLARLLAPNRIAFVTAGGSRSLVWYFMLKNFAADFKPPPKLAVIFYRDFDFNVPDEATGGKRGREARAFMRPGDEALMAEIQGAEYNDVESWLEALEPEAYARSRREKLLGIALSLATVGRVSKLDIQAAHEVAFDFDKLRPGVMDAGGLANDALDLDRKIFTDDPQENLLSRFHSVAAAHGIRLCFFRVKRRPDAAGLAPSSPELTRYTADLKAWLEERGHVLVDETDDPRLTLALYHDGDHLAKFAMSDWTRIFAERIGAVMPVPPAPAAE